MKNLFLFSFLFLISCSTPISNKNPLGNKFPSIKGSSLTQKQWRIPEDFKGQKTLLLIGYDMDAQFDIDRWILGLIQLKIKVPIYELPTIKGMVPRMISSKINQGMRNGIPQEDWGIVITVYEDSEKLISFTGNELPLNARVVLLSEKGETLFFHDRGYSAQTLMTLVEKIKD